MVSFFIRFDKSVIWKIWFALFAVAIQILKAEGDCKLVNSSPQEKKLLQKLKPLYGHTFETKDVFKSVNYTYKINICDKVEKQEEGVGAVQYTVNDTFLHNLGRYDKVELIGGNNWIFLTYYGGDHYDTHCNKSNRITNIMISCVPDVLYGKLEILEEKHSNISNCFYLFELESSAACNSNSNTDKEPSNNHLSFGSVFCILFFTFGSVYLVLGFLYKRLVIGAKGLEQIPNYAFWREFGNLEADGCDFLCRCGPRHESQAYRGIDDHLKMEDERDDQLLN